GCAGPGPVDRPGRLRSREQRRDGAPAGGGAHRRLLAAARRAGRPRRAAASGGAAGQRGRRRPQHLIASQRIEYARPLGHRRDGVVVRLWLSRVGGASLSVDYLVLTRDDPEGAAPYARARTVVVLIDAETEAPVRLEQGTRTALEAFRGEPLRF